MSPIMNDLQKFETENRLLTEQNKRLKLEMLKKDPNFDFYGVLNSQPDTGNR